ncbi:MAG: hypothetical protein H0T46_06555 [Deltaproteobacteria bacterium]|nr:hypothetical protein [Deltaproteobacteria bacterium]
MTGIELGPGVVAFRGILEAGTPTHSYAIMCGDFSVLVDVRDESAIPALRELPRPRHLLLTHRHVRKHERAIQHAFGLDVWLHAADASAPRRGPAEHTPHAETYRDPYAEPQVLAALGFTFLHVPGHTPGCSFVMLDRDGGMLFTGDAVVGVKPGQPAGIELPPDWTCDDAAASRSAVLAIAPSLPPHRAILPSHGEPIANATVAFTRGLWEGLRAPS